MPIIIGGTSIQAVDAPASSVRKLYSGPISVGASVGRNSCAQLMNPAASGVTLIVRRVDAVSVTAHTLQLRQHNTALTTNVGGIINLYSGGAAGTGQNRSEQPASVPGTLILARQYAALEDAPIISDWEFVLPPGTGLVLANPTQNEALTGAFRWLEQS